MKVMFIMSCGHAEEKEVADPKKYLKIDHDYYKQHGLCNKCWAALHEQHRQYRMIRDAAPEAQKGAQNG